MSRSRPTNRFLEGNFAPWLLEGDAFDLVVDGEIPRELAGSYFRNGSNPHYSPGPNYHWFEGDGMIHGFTFDEGRCHYRNRWVRTARLELERREGRSVFGGFMGRSEPDEVTEGTSGNASNTNVVWHAGRLLSLWEAGPPYELDPRTLDTIGLWDYEGKFQRERFGAMAPDIMTAHPKIDPDTGEWVAFGYSPLAPHLVYHLIDADGKLVRSDEIEVPYASMMHDFVVSQQHTLFPVMPAAFDFEAMARTGSILDWQPERGSHIGILERHAPASEIVWIEKDQPSFCFHYANAVTTGSTIVADVWHLPAVSLFGEDGLAPEAPKLHRWTIDLDARTLADEALDDAPAEFGRVDDRYVGKPYRHLYSLGTLAISKAAGEPEFFNSLFHYDMVTGGRKAHRLPSPGDCFGEPQFVPRSPDAPEGDGFVIAIAYRASENRSDVLVLDAQNIEAPPLATIHCPHRIPFGFHGNWMPADRSQAG